MARKKLPTVGTSAASTAFCAAEIKGPGGSLWIDGNGKITRGNGTLDTPRPNAFSLRAQAVTDAAGQDHVDCPGSTAVCRSSCYVGGLEKHARATYDLYEHNSVRIREILASNSDGYWALLVASWIRRNAKGGFRWHVSGDVFSSQYAEWIARVCGWSKNVPHWIYTRNLDILPELAEVSTLRGGNLAINVSADRDNYQAAKIASEVNGIDGTPLRICFLSDDGQVPHDLRDGDVIFPDYSLRGGTELGREWFGNLAAAEKAMTCPVDYHGKSEVRRCGPCARCLT